MPEFIDSILKENRVFYPHEEFSRKSHIKSMKEYSKIYKKSIDDPIKFWAEKANKSGGTTADKYKLFMQRFSKIEKIQSELIAKLSHIQSLEDILLNYNSTISWIVQNLYLAFFVRRSNNKTIKLYELEVKKAAPRLIGSVPSNIEPEEFYNINFRNLLAVRKMLKTMQEGKQNTGIIVFGKGHTEGLISEFQKQTGSKINIIVIEKPDR